MDNRVKLLDLTSITSLRFFAAFWVVCFHFGDLLSFSFSENNPILNGMRPVDFFFILSGFILAHVYGPQLTSGRFRMRSFLVKRFARLYPVHLVTLLASLSIFLLATALGIQLNNPDKYDMRQLIPNLLLVQTWFPFTRAAFNMPSWSISAELAAYLLFPLLAGAVLSKWRGAWWWLAATVVIFAAFEAFSQIVIGHSVLRLIELSVFRILPLFTLGLVLWKGWNARIFIVPRWVMWPAVAGSLALCAYPFATVPMFALIILAAAERNFQQKPGLLGAAPLVFLGEASYSLYMVHGPIQTVYAALVNRAHIPLDNPSISVAVFTGGLLLSILASIVMYKMIEEPCRVLITRWLNGRFLASGPNVVI